MSMATKIYMISHKYPELVFLERLVIRDGLTQLSHAESIKMPFFNCIQSLRCVTPGEKEQHKKITAL